MKNKNLLKVLFILSFTIVSSVFLYKYVYACPDTNSCNYNGDDTWDCNYYVCGDNSCVSDESQCPVLSCEDQSKITCSDGSCADSFDACPCDNPAQTRCSDGTCQYSCECQGDSCNNCDPGTDPNSCKVYYCPVKADAQATCEATNPPANGWSCVGSYDACEKAFYCDDFDTPALNPQTKDDCQIANPDRQCIADNNTCQYPNGNIIKYCSTDPNQPSACENSKANPRDICSPDASVCPKSYCGYIVSIEYEFKGVIYNTTVSASYWYDPNISSCVIPTSDYLTVLMENALAPYETPPASSVTATGASITPVNDQCSNISGNQSYSDYMSNSYTRDENNNCVQKDCPLDNPNCSFTNASCGTALAKIITAGDINSDGTIANACGLGNASKATLNGNTYSWTCDSANGGENASCFAYLGCGDGQYYCPDSGTCKLNSEQCQPGNPDGENPLIGGHDGPVHLNSLKVNPPIINFDDTCHIKWDKSSAVFDSYASSSAANPTHCVLSNQDGVLKNFDPGTDTSLGYNQLNVKKDTLFTLKCWDGSDNSNPQTVTGTCRINTKQGEFN